MIKSRRKVVRKKPLGKGQKIQLEQKTRSGLETRALKLLESKGISYEYEPKDKKLDYVIPATKHKYLPDIIIGDTIYELKGYWSDKDKMLHIIKSNPNQKIVMVFMKDQPIRKGSKTMYSDWCIKKNIPYMMYEQFEKLIQSK